MIDKNKILDLILDLNESTSKEKTLWSKKSAPQGLIDGTDDKASGYYELINTKNIYKVAIYTRNCFKSEHERLYERSLGTSSIFGDTKKISDWTSKIELCFIDEFDDLVFRTSDHQSALRDLYQTIKMKTLKIDQFIDQIRTELK